LAPHLRSVASGTGILPWIAVIWMMRQVKLVAIQPVDSRPK